jgi:hypothetical protein
VPSLIGGCFGCHRIFFAVRCCLFFVRAFCLGFDLLYHQTKKTISDRPAGGPELTLILNLRPTVFCEDPLSTCLQAGPRCLGLYLIDLDGRDGRYIWMREFITSQNRHPRNGAQYGSLHVHAVSIMSLTFLFSFRSSQFTDFLQGDAFKCKFRPSCRIMG